MKMKRFFSVSLAALMATTSFTPAMAANLTTGGQSTAAVETSGGSGTSPVTVTAEATTFDVSVPLALPVHVDGLGIVTTATDANILNKSFGKVKVDAVDFTAADDWALAEYGADLSNVAVGTKSIGMKIAGALSNPSLANGVYTDATGATQGDVNDAFSVIPGVTYDRDEEGNQTLSGMSTLLLKYSATVPAQKDAIESAETAANVVFTLVWDGSGSTGGSGSNTPSSNVLEGDGQTFHRLAPTALTFRSTEPISEFQEVLVNGEVVDESNYTLTEGSTIVTLSADYLQTLDTSVHEVTIVSTNNDPSGEFEVIEPVQDANSKIYYNQPYGGYVECFQSNAIVFIREDNTMDVIVTSDNSTETCPYTIDGTNMVVTTTGFGDLNCTILEDGASICVTALGATFNLANENVAVADEDYIYIYSDELGGYEVMAIDKTKSSYTAIKTGIYDIPTVGVGHRAFWENTNLVSMPEMPDTVVSIGDAAFWGCTSLTSISIPDNITSVSSNAFASCNNVSTVTIGNGVNDIEFLDSYMYEISDLTIGTGVTAIPDRMFEDPNVSGISKLNKVTFKEGSQLIAIGDRAFYGCTNLTSINIPGSVTAIGDSAFYGCEALKEAEIPPIKNIPSKTFYGCKSLTKVTMPDTVKNIGEFAFFDCTSLTDMLIPDGVTSIGTSAFSSCESLESISIPDGVITISDRAFSHCDSLARVTIPDSVTTIGAYSFSYCNNLKDVFFDGTMSEWNDISLSESWCFKHNGETSLKEVICSDGTVAL